MEVNRTEVRGADVDVQLASNPNISVSMHPLNRDTAILPTSSLEEFVNVLREWLASRLTGGVVWGNNRMGKTDAVRYLMRNATELLGAPIPVGLLSTWDTSFSSLTENRFFGEILTTLGYAMPFKGTAAQKRHRIINLIKERVLDSGDYRYLLVIDEAQFLANVQLRYLMDIHNQLKIVDIHLVCILVGTEELIDIRTTLRNEKQAHLLGRFMMDTHQYKGICSEKDLSRITYALDAQSEFPAGSAKSYTQFFVPVAFEHGFRLDKHSADIWLMLAQTLESHSLPKCNEYPIISIMTLVVWILQELEQQDCPELKLTKSMIEEGICRRALISIVDSLEQ